METIDALATKKEAGFTVLVTIYRGKRSETRSDVCESVSMERVEVCVLVQAVTILADLVRRIRHRRFNRKEYVIANRRDSRESDCSNCKIIWAEPFCIFSRPGAYNSTYHPIRVQ